MATNVKDETADPKIVAELKKRENIDGIYAATAAGALGFGFGFFLNKSRVIEPLVIAKQFHWIKWQMMKVFLSGTASSCFALAVLKIIAYDEWVITRIKSKSGPNLINTVLGGLMLGAGMALAGGCPGLIFAQVGAGVPYALLSLCGGVCGAFTFGIIEPHLIKKYHLFETPHIPADKGFLDHVLNIDYSIAATLFGSGLYAFAYYLETLFPFEKDLARINPNPNTLANLLKNPIWHPLVAGTALGMLQLGTSLTLGNTVGGSSAYACVAGQCLTFADEETKDTYSHFKAQYRRWWQLLFLLCAAGGSLTAAHIGGADVRKILSGQTDESIDGVSASRAFWGAYVMIFGSRLAKGCASGHGLSGMGLLSMASFAAVAAMFGGGAIVGQFLKK